MKLVAGLGNPGKEYEHTRHNMGFDVIDELARRWSVNIWKTDMKAEIASVVRFGEKILLVKPLTYMNLSGNAVRYWMQQYNIPVERLLVICDDLNLPFGAIRMRKQGSDGGHNGLKNIIELIGTQDFCRVRLGIGNEFAQGQQVDFVLGRLDDAQMERMEEISKKVIEGVRNFALMGADKAMNLLNTR